MFMGGAGQQTRGRNRERVGADLEATVTLDFKEAVFGTERTLHFNAEETCSRCEGNGADPGSKVRTCDTCKGSGHVTHVQQTILGAIRQTAVCPTCEGDGEIPEKRCTQCHGKGTVKAAQELNVKIPAGVDNGITIRLSGKGGAIKKGKPGDLYVHVRVNPDRQLKRKGQNIESEVVVPMVEAALGTEVPVETVDGDVGLKIPAGTQSGKIFKLSERGVPGFGGRKRGDHLVTVIVETPQKLNDKQKALLEEFAAQGVKKRKLW